MIRLTEIELREPDVNKFAALARAHQPAASLSGATAGDLDRSLRQRELRRPSGFADELRAVLSGTTGTWGSLTRVAVLIASVRSRSRRHSAWVSAAR
jgi:hypothetical protein